MLEIRKPTQKSVVVIRTATGNELSNYEKHKLANIEANAQENKIEVLKINDEPLQVDPQNKEVCIYLGDLAFNNTITPSHISEDNLFLIKCVLDEN